MNRIIRNFTVSEIRSINNAIKSLERDKRKAEKVIAEHDENINKLKEKLKGVLVQLIFSSFMKNSECLLTEEEMVLVFQTLNLSDNE